MRGELLGEHYKVLIALFRRDEILAMLIQRERPWNTIGKRLALTKNIRNLNKNCKIDVVH